MFRSIWAKDHLEAPKTRAKSLNSWYIPGMYQVCYNVCLKTGIYLVHTCHMKHKSIYQVTVYTWCIRSRTTPLDEQGLDISSPWRISGDDPIVSVLRPKLYAAWLSKEQWVGCREVEEDVRKVWEQAQLCLAACASLGSAEPAFISTSQFLGTQVWKIINTIRCNDLKQNIIWTFMF
jgi:hypothetical protein